MRTRADVEAEGEEVTRKKSNEERQAEEQAEEIERQARVFCRSRHVRENAVMLGTPTPGSRAPRDRDARTLGELVPSLTRRELIGSRGRHGARKES